MSKSKKSVQSHDSAQDMQKLYARAYASRLSKQVADEVDSSRRKATRLKKSDGKG